MRFQPRLSKALLGGTTTAPQALICWVLATPLTFFFVLEIRNLKIIIIIIIK